MSVEIDIDGDSAKNAAETTVDLYTFPEGGLRSWSVVAGGWFVAFSVFGYSNAFGIFQSLYANGKLQTYSPSQIAWIGSLLLFMTMATGSVSGMLFDKGFCRPTIFAGSLLIILCVMLNSIASQYWQIILLQGLFQGIGSGLVFTPSMSCVATYFKKRRALAIGLTASGSSVGGIVWPIMINNLATKDFESGIRAAGYLFIGCLTIANLLIRPRFKAPPIRQAWWKIIDLAVFRDLRFSLYCAGTGMLFAGIYLPIFFIQDYAIAHGMSPSLAFYLLSFLNAGSFFGRTFPNWLADKVGTLNVMIVSCSIACLMVFFFSLLGSNVAGTIAFAILYGSFSGTFLSIMPPAIASLSDDISTVGRRIGSAFLVGGLGVLIGSPIEGAIITASSGSYVGASVFSGGVMLLGLGCLCITWWLHSRRRKSLRI